MHYISELLKQEKPVKEDLASMKPQLSQPRSKTPSLSSALHRLAFQFKIKPSASVTFIAILLHCA
jgi:hypothetical protein